MCLLLTNAGDANIYTTSLQSRMNVDAFLIYTIIVLVILNGRNKIKDWYPTNPQAEILVFGAIPIKYIDCIYFQDYETLYAFKHIILIILLQKYIAECLVIALIGIFGRR